MAANNKIVLGTGEVLLDLTADTVTANTVAVGKTFHLASGESAIGTMEGGGSMVEATVTYQASSSGTMPPTGEWLDSPPEVAEGQYLWTKSYVLYSTGASYTAYSVGYHGEKGKDGTSPTATVTQTSTGATVTVTDASGTTTATLTNGKDGVSPTIDTITDAQIDALFA